MPGQDESAPWSHCSNVCLHADLGKHVTFLGTWTSFWAGVWGHHRIFAEALSSTQGLNELPVFHLAWPVEIDRFGSCAGIFDCCKKQV